MKIGPRLCEDNELNDLVADFIYVHIYNINLDFTGAVEEQRHGDNEDEDLVEVQR